MKAILTACVSLLLGATVWGAIDQGLIAYYPFNGDANDESGNGWHGTIHGATLTTNRFGDVNSAFVFDGFNDYIDIGNCLGTEKTPFTVSIWVCSTAGIEAGPDIYIAKKDSGPWEPGQWGLSSGINKIAQFTFNDYDGNNIPPRAIIADKDVRDGVWHHLCATMSHEGSKLYIDGELVGTNNVPKLVAQHNSRILIGRRVDSFQPYYTEGTLDDIRIYNRALSHSEIKDLFSQPLPFTEFIPAVTHVKFGDENNTDTLSFSGKIVLNELGNGLDFNADEIVIEAGPLTMDIPAGSLQKHGKVYKYENSTLKILFNPAGANSYLFSIQIYDVDLTGWTNPADWSLRIGDDIGFETKWLKGHLHD